jgi:hypothetical protein
MYKIRSYKTENDTKVERRNERCVTSGKSEFNREANGWHSQQRKTNSANTKIDFSEFFPGKIWRADLFR